MSLVAEIILNSAFHGRHLEEDDHDGHYDKELNHEQEEKLRNVKIIVIVFLFFAGAFVYFPYLPMVQRK
jgi:hypothetical protein